MGRRGEATNPWTRSGRPPPTWRAARVPADEMHRDAGMQLRVAVVKAHAPGVRAPHHSHHVLHVVGAAELRLGHVAAGGVAHLEILQMQRRRRKKIEVADMVVMQMGDYYVL